MTRMFPIVALVVASFACSLSGQCTGAGVQSNTPAATLTINGRAGDGFGGTPPQDVIRTSSITVTISGAPFVPVILAVGTPIAGGQSIAPFGCLNVNPVLFVLDGFSASGFGAYTTSSGSLTLAMGVPPSVPIGSEFTLQAFVGNATTGGALTAPQRIRISYATIAYRADQELNDVTELFGATATGSQVVKLSVPQGIFATPGVEPGYAWSPDGTKIAYTTVVLFETNLFVSDADGQNPIQISPSGDVSEFQWAPDGSRIAF